MKVLIIIPAYNEESNIVRVVENLSQYGYDYVVINDCSKDGTREILQKNRFNYLDFPVNLGIGGAVQAGYIYALENGYDIAIQMDGDGQHPPEYLGKLIQPILNGEADAVIGSRFVNADNAGFQSSALRRAGIKFLSWLINLVCKVKVMDVTSGFRAVNRSLIKVYARNYAQDYPEPEAIITAARYGARVKEVPVEMSERLGGVSSISGFKSIYYMIKVSIAIVTARFTIKE